jgi:hypothetical protein
LIFSLLVAAATSARVGAALCFPLDVAENPAKKSLPAGALRVPLIERRQPFPQPQRIELRDGKRSEATLGAPRPAHQPVAASPRRRLQRFVYAGQQLPVAGFGGSAREVFRSHRKK